MLGPRGGQHRVHIVFPSLLQFLPGDSTATGDATLTASPKRRPVSSLSVFLKIKCPPQANLKLSWVYADRTHPR